MFVTKFKIEAAVNQRILLEDAARARSRRRLLAGWGGQLAQRLQQRQARWGADAGRWLMEIGGQLLQRYEVSIQDGLGRATAEVSLEGKPC